MTDCAIIPEGDDPIAALLAVAVFGDGSRGLCEIYVESPDAAIQDHNRLGMPPGSLTSGLPRKILALCVLGARPQDDPVPLFEHETRALRCCKLAGWLKERGLSPAGAQWVTKLAGLHWAADPNSANRVRWELIVKAPALPALPPETAMDHLRSAGYTRRFNPLHTLKDVDHA